MLNDIDSEQRMFTSNTPHDTCDRRVIYDRYDDQAEARLQQEELQQHCFIGPIMVSPTLSPDCIPIGLASPVQMTI